MRPLLILLALLTIAGCKAIDEREQYAFAINRLEGDPEPPRVLVTPRPGALLITGIFHSCGQPRLDPSVARSGRSLRVLLQETACRSDAPETAWFSYELNWWGLEFGEQYNLRVEHHGERGSADGVVLETSARTL